MKEILRELFLAGIYFLESYVLVYFAVGKMMNNES